MKKAVDFSTYKHLRKMSFADFNRWVTSIYMSGVQDGLKEGEKELNECSTFTAEELTSFLAQTGRERRLSLGARTEVVDSY